jgi:hypothetical protein
MNKIIQIRLTVSMVGLILLLILSSTAFAQSLDIQALQQARAFFSRMYRQCGDSYYYKYRDERFHIFQCKYPPSVTISGRSIQPRRLSEADRLNGVDPLPIAWEGSATINLGLCRRQDFYGNVELGTDSWQGWIDQNNDSLSFKNVKGAWEFYNEPTGGEMYTKKVIVPVSCEEVPDPNRVVAATSPSWGKDRNGNWVKLPATNGEWFYLGRGPMVIRPSNPYTFIYIDGSSKSRGIEGGGRNPQALAPAALLGALIVKLGEYGTPFQIFKPQDTITQLDGYKITSNDNVYIAINDSVFTDNRGAHVVNVSGSNLCINCGRVR